MNLKELGINEAVGGSVMVINATVVEHRSYKGNDGSMKHPTKLLYFGGNMELKGLEPTHWIKTKGEGEQVTFAQRFIQDQYGWKSMGQPIEVVTTQESPAKTKTTNSTPSSS